MSKEFLDIMEKELLKAQGISRNSMLIWWPKIKDLGIPVPKTEIVPCDHQAILKWMEGEDKLPDEFLTELYGAASRLGFPLFLRTDLCSGKHGWKNTCFVEHDDSDLILRHLHGVCEENEMAGIFGLPYQAIVLREFLQLETRFKAFYGDMPINREFRLFVRDGEIECLRPYWPHSAIKGHTKARYWNAKLTEMNKLFSREEMFLRNYAEKAGKALPGYWSIDFAYHKDGRWFLIDCATGDDSYHWPECKRSEKL